MKKIKSFFDIYQHSCHNATLFEWMQIHSHIMISPKEFIYMGELITLEGADKIPRTSNYVLTNNSLINTNETVYKDQINAFAILPISNPKLSKKENRTLNLYFHYYNRFGFLFSGYKGH